MFEMNKRRSLWVGERRSTAIVDVMPRNNPGLVIALQGATMREHHFWSRS